MPRFQYISWFLALLALPVFGLLYYAVLSWKKKTTAKIGDLQLVREMTGNYAPRRFAAKFLLICLAFSAGVFALANLRSPSGMEKVNRNGIDVMIALDVSKSMLAQDISPTRLDRAKQLLGKLIDRLANDRIGIVLFAGRAYLQMPLTGDHSAAKMFLSTASPESVPTQGTVLTDALQMCRSAFSTREKKYKAVILISDGEDHDEGAATLASKMAEEGIVINTIGIGSPSGAEIMEPGMHEPKKDEQGNIVITKLNEKELMAIAEKGNGTYQLYTNTDQVAGNLEASLGSMDQRSIKEDSLVNYRHYFPWFLLLALGLLVFELVLSEQVRKLFDKGENKHKAVMLTVLFILLCPVWTNAQGSKKLIRKGNEAYEKKEYGNAITNYSQASEKNPADAIAPFNLGNALYRSNKTDEAIAAYDQAADKAIQKDDRAKAYYNKGVVLQNAKKLPECIDAYKRSLKLNPADEDARQNLQKALQQQKQQRQQKEKKEKQQQKKEDKKEQAKDEKKNEQPKPQPSKISKQDAIEKLKALLEQEKNLQDKLRKVETGVSGKPEKDW